MIDLPKILRVVLSEGDRIVEASEEIDILVRLRCAEECDKCSQCAEECSCDISFHIATLQHCNIATLHLFHIATLQLMTDCTHGTMLLFVQ